MQKFFNPGAASHAVLFVAIHRKTTTKKPHGDSDGPVVYLRLVKRFLVPSDGLGRRSADSSIDRGFHNQGRSLT